MTNIHVIRRANLRTLIEERGAASVAKAAGYATTSYLSQMAGPNPLKLITEKTARRIEEGLHLQNGWMDREQNLFGTVEPTAKPRVVEAEPSSVLDEDHFTRCAYAVSSACSEHDVKLPRDKFGMIVKMVMANKDPSDDAILHLADALVSLAK